MTPPCFTSAADRLHFSPFALEISVADGHGKCVAISPIEQGVSTEVLAGMREIEGSLASPVPHGEAAVALQERIETACGNLLALHQHNACDLAEWERFIAVHGWDDWPPAVQSTHERLLDTAADMEFGKLPIMATACWEHAMRRSMAERQVDLLIDDQQFFEVGLPILCPNAHLRQWGDLVPSLNEQERRVGMGRR